MEHRTNQERRVLRQDRLAQRFGTQIDHRRAFRQRLGCQKRLPRLLRDNLPTKTGSNLVMITSDKAEGAGKVRESLRSLERQGMLSMDDPAAIFEEGEGKIHVKNQTDRGMVVIADQGARRREPASTD